MERTARSAISTVNSSGTDVARKTFEELEELRRSCGLERGCPRSIISFEQQQLFAYARSQCLSHLTGDGSAFIAAKEDALTLLYDLLVFDPLESEVTANELTTLTKGLQGVMEGIEEKLPRLQAKYAKVYGAALDCLASHYALGHIGKITEETKTILKTTPKILKKLNREDPQVQFYAAYASEAAEKLTSDRRAQDKIFSGVVNFAKTCRAAYELDLKEVWGNFRATVREMHTKKLWFEGILFQRKILQEVWDSPSTLVAFQEVVSDWGLEKKGGASISDWKYLMGAIDSLTDLIIYSPNTKVAQSAFYGRLGGTSPGLLDLLEFEAFKIKGRFKSLDTNWHIRFGVCQALATVWAEGPRELKLPASEALLRHKAREADERVIGLIDKILGEDRALQRSWKHSIVDADVELKEEKEEIKKGAAEIDELRDLLSNHLKALEEKKNSYQAQSRKLETQKKKLADRSKQLESLEAKVTRLEKEQLELKKAEKDFDEVEDELIEATEDLVSKKRALEKLSAKFEKSKSDQEAKLLEAKKSLDVEKHSFEKQQLLLKEKEAAFTAKQERFDSKVKEFTLKLAQVKQLEDDAALAFNLQQYEYWEAEQRAKEKLERAEGPLAVAAAPVASNASDLLLCPISAEPMHDAVSTPYGHTYSEKAILTWLVSNKTDPMTSRPLSADQLVPNWTIRSLAGQFAGTASSAVVHAGTTARGEDLYLAALEGERDRVGLLIRNGVNVNYRGVGGNTPLHVAAEEGHAQIVEVLLKEGASIKLRNQKGLYCWDVALTGGHTQVLELLIPKMPLKHLKTFFSGIASGGNVTHLETLAGSVPKRRCYEVLKATFEASNVSAAALLKSFSFIQAVNAKNRHLWEIALEERNPELVRFLIPAVSESLAHPFYEAIFESGLFATEAQPIPPLRRYPFFKWLVDGDRNESLALVEKHEGFITGEVSEGKHLWNEAASQNHPTVLARLAAHVPSKLRYTFLVDVVKTDESALLEPLLEPDFLQNGKEPLWTRAFEEEDTQVLKIVAGRIPENFRFELFRDAVEKPADSVVQMLFNAPGFLPPSSNEGHPFWISAAESSVQIMVVLKSHMPSALRDRAFKHARKEVQRTWEFTLGEWEKKSENDRKLAELDDEWDHEYENPREMRVDGFPYPYNWELNVPPRHRAHVIEVALRNGGDVKNFLDKWVAGKARFVPPATLIPYSEVDSDRRSDFLEYLGHLSALRGGWTGFANVVALPEEDWKNCANKLTSLQNLEIRGVHVGEELLTFTRLKYLKIRTLPEPLEKLSLLAKLKGVTIDLNAGTCSAETVGQLGTLSTFNGLSLDGGMVLKGVTYVPRPIEKGVVEQLPSFSQLTSLHLSHWQFDGVALERFGEMPNLNSLSLSCFLSEEGAGQASHKIEGLAACTSLTRLCLDQFRLVGGASLEPLVRLTALEDLEVIRTRGLSSSVFTVVGELPMLKRLVLSHLEEMKGELLRPIQKLNHLRVFEMEGFEMEGEGELELGALSSLSGLDSLEELALRRGLVGNGSNLSELSSLQRLRSLDLSGNWSLDSSYLTTLTSLGSLRSLNLSACEIDNVDPILSLTTLEILNMSNNPLNSKLKTLADKMLSLRTLNVKGCIRADKYYSVEQLYSYLQQSVRKRTDRWFLDVKL